MLDFLKEPRDIFHRGVDRTNNGDFQAAIQDFTRAIEYGYQAAPVYLFRGSCKACLGDFDGAIVDLNTSLKVSSIVSGDTINAYYFIGKTYIAMEQYPNASWAYKCALDTYGIQSELICNVLGPEHLHGMMKEYVKHIEDIKRTLPLLERSQMKK